MTEPVLLFLVIPLLAFISWSFTYLLIKFLTKLGILDHPNARSNHKVPVPVGGGISIIFTFGLAIWFFYEGTEPSLYSEEAISIFLFALILLII